MYMMVVNACLLSILICVINNFLAKFISSIKSSKLKNHNDCQEWLKENPHHNFLNTYSQLKKAVYYWFIVFFPMSFSVSLFLSLFKGESFISSFFSFIFMLGMVAISLFILIKLHIYKYCKQQN